MKNNTAQDIVHEGTLGANRVLMRFSEDAAGRAHLMSLLTDAYSDKEAATIRELSCNGLDAQIEAGYDGPLEVTTPTQMMPYLIIEDHGTGMSVDFINGTFSEFGGSTKRNTNDQVGFWGIGGKSPLTLTKQFTFFTVHNGVKATVLVSRDEVGAAGVEIIDTVATKEPNGTRFKIPVEAPQYVARKVYAFFKWWPKGSVLIDGREPERPEPAQVLDPWVEVHNGLQRDIVIMGNIAYPVSHEHRLTSYLKHGYNVVVRIPMGEVNVTPNREALQYTDLTLETLSLARDWISNTMKQAFQSEIEACPSMMEAWKKTRSINSQLDKHIDDFYWRGMKVPGYGASIRTPTRPTGVSRSEWDGRHVWFFRANLTTRSGRISGGSVHVEALDKSWVVVNYPYKTVSAHAQAKIMRWQQENDIHMTTRIILDPEEGRFDLWVQQDRIVDWEVIAQYKAKPERSAPRDVPTFTYHRLVPGATRFERQTITEIPAKGRLIYYSPSDDRIARHDKHSREMLGDYLCRMFPKAYVFSLASNRHAKFSRDNTRAKHVFEILEEFEHKLKNLDDHTKFMLAGGSTFRQRGLGRLYSLRNEVLDNEVVEVLEFMRPISNRLVEQYDRYKTLCWRTGRYFQQVRMPEKFSNTFGDVNERYAVSDLHCSIEELLECVNALHQYRNPTTEA